VNQESGMNPKRDAINLVCTGEGESREWDESQERRDKSRLYGGVGGEEGF